MSRLNNGEKRMFNNQIPEIFIETTDRYYFYGHGYSKGSLSPIKLDFTEMATRPEFRKFSSGFSPIVQNVCKVSGDIYESSDLFKFNNFKQYCTSVKDIVDDNIEYILSNSYNGVVIAKRDILTGEVKFRDVTSNNASYPSICGQSKDYIYIIVHKNTQVISIRKSDLYTSAVKFRVREGADFNGSFVFNEVDSFTSHLDTNSNTSLNLCKVQENNKNIIIIGNSRPSSRSVRCSVFIIDKSTNTGFVDFIEYDGIGFDYGKNYEGDARFTPENIHMVDDNKFYFYQCIYSYTNKQYALVKVIYNIENMSYKTLTYYEDKGFKINYIPGPITISHFKINLKVENNVDVISFINLSTTSLHSSYNQSIRSELTTVTIDNRTNDIYSCYSESLLDNDVFIDVFMLDEDTMVAFNDYQATYLMWGKKALKWSTANSEQVNAATIFMKTADNSIFYITDTKDLYTLPRPKSIVEMYCKFENDSYKYNDKEIDTNVLVGVMYKNSKEFIETNVTLTLSENCVFTANDENEMKITTSNFKELKIPVVIKSAGNITAKIDLDLERKDEDEDTRGK